MSCQTHQSLGRTLTLSAFKEEYGFNGAQSADQAASAGTRNKGTLIILSGWVNPDQFIQSGRCRRFLAPT
jgi:hypothetical protein